MLIKTAIRHRSAPALTRLRINSELFAEIFAHERRKTHQQAVGVRSMSDQGVALGVEEIWNQKQLAKAVGTAVASARVAGHSRELASIEASTSTD